MKTITLYKEQIAKQFPVYMLQKEYKKYLEKTTEPIPYRDWLRDKNE